MKIAVINGSPKGKYSITLQTVLYLQRKFPEHTFEVLHAGQKIKALEKDFSAAKQLMESADAVLFGCFQKHFSNIRPRKRAKVRRFSKKILKADLLPYGETWAVLTSVFQTFSSLSAIRRKTCCFDQVFSQNFFCFLHHTEKRMPFC